MIKAIILASSFKKKEGVDFVVMPSESEFEKLRRQAKENFEAMMFEDRIKVNSKCIAFEKVL